MGENSIKSKHQFNIFNICFKGILRVWGEEYKHQEKMAKEVTKEIYLELKDVSLDQVIKFQNIKNKLNFLNISREKKYIYHKQKFGNRKTIELLNRISNAER